MRPDAKLHRFDQIPGKGFSGGRKWITTGEILLVTYNDNAL